MDIFIIHGEYFLKSYDRLQQYLDKAKEKKWEILNVQGLALYIQNSLFEAKRLIVIRDSKLLKKQDFVWLKKQRDNSDDKLVIYNDGKISETFIKSLPPIKKIEEFKLPKSIFNFLDSFFPGNSTGCLNLLHQIIEYEPVEFVFSLLGKTLRDLYWVKISPSDIPYPSWRVDKLERQASRFSEELIKELITDFAEIDIKAKTSQGDLIDSLDLLIIQKLQ